MTNTGVRIVVVVDMVGRTAANTSSAHAAQGQTAYDSRDNKGYDNSKGDKGDRAGSEATTYAPSPSLRDREAYMVGLRESDLRPAFKALQRAYVALLRNPFYDPDEHDPVLAMQNAAAGGGGGGGEGNLEIRNKRFVAEVERVGRMWYPGIGAF